MTDLTSQLAALRALRDTVTDPVQRAALDEAIALYEATAAATTQQIIRDEAAGIRRHTQQISVGDAQVGFAIAGDVHGDITIAPVRLRDTEQLLIAYLRSLPLRYRVAPLLSLNNDRLIRLPEVYVEPAVTNLVEREAYSGRALEQFEADKYLARHATDRPVYVVGSRFEQPQELPEPISSRSSSRRRRGETAAISPSTGLDTSTLTSEQLAEIARSAERLTFYGPQLIHEAIAANRQLVLLGEPGSGKTTVLQYLAIALAEAQLTSGVDPLHILEPIEKSTLLPIALPVLSLVQRLGENSSRSSLTNAIYDQIAEQLNLSGRLDEIVFAVRKQLQAGSVLLMLDGLDEIPKRSMRREIGRIIQQFTDLYPACRVVVTCRTRAYADDLSGWATVTLADWTIEQADRFIHLIYAAFGQETDGSSYRRASFVRAIHESAELRQLAARPLLLTIMTLLERVSGLLPNDRVNLVSRSVDMLLNIWLTPGRDNPFAAPLSGPPAQSIGDISLWRPALERAAFAAQEGDVGSFGRVRRTQLKKILLDTLIESGRHTSVDVFLDYIDTRAGLLQSSDSENYVFTHLLFQEFLAGLELVRGSDFVERIMVRRTDERWREPILFGLQYQVSQGVLSIVYDVLKTLINSANRTSDQARRDILFAADIVDAIGWERLVRGGVAFTELRDQLSQALARIRRRSSALSREWKNYVAAASQHHDQPPPVARTIANRVAQAVQSNLTDQPSAVASHPMFLLNTTTLFDETVIPQQIPLLIWCGAIDANANELWREVKIAALSLRKLLALVLPVTDRSKSPLSLMLRAKADVDGIDLVILARHDLETLEAARDPRRAFWQIVLDQASLVRISPYQIASAVSGNRFFGREREIRSVRDGISTGSFTLVGARRIGKTSILQRLESVELLQSDYLALYINAQSWDKRDGEKNYDMLLKRLNEAYRAKGGQESSAKTLTDFVTTLPDRRSLVLLIDEADRLLSADRLSDWRLYGELRTLSQTKLSQCVFAGEAALRAARLDAGTPFYNFTGEITVGRFDRTVVAEMFTRPMEQMGLTLMDAEQSINLMFTFTGGHPNIVQRLCARLVARLQKDARRELTPFDVQLVIDDPTFQREDFLNTYFQRTSPLERIIMLIMSKAQRPMVRSAIRDRMESLGIRTTTQRLEAALQSLTTLREMLDYGQEGYRCAISGFPTVLGTSILANDMLEEAIEEFRRRRKKRS